jgi:hypothetical protein
VNEDDRLAPAILHVRQINAVHLHLSYYRRVGRLMPDTLATEQEERREYESATAYLHVIPPMVVARLTGADAIHGTRSQVYERDPTIDYRRIYCLTTENS